MIEDAKVQDYWNKYGTRTSAKAAVAGFPNYKKNVDLEECLDRRDNIWNLNDEKSQKRIFTKKRGYTFGYEDKVEKEKEKQKEDSGKVIGEALMLKEDEIIILKRSV